MMSTNSYLDILHVVGLKTRTHGQFGGVAVQCGLLGIAGVDVGDRVLRGGRVARGGDEGNGAQAEGDDRSSSKDLLSDACAEVRAHSWYNGAHAGKQPNGKGSTASFSQLLAPQKLQVACLSATGQRMLRWCQRRPALSLKPRPQ